MEHGVKGKVRNKKVSIVLVLFRNRSIYLRMAKKHFSFIVNFLDLSRGSNRNRFECTVKLLKALRTKTFFPAKYKEEMHFNARF